MNVALGGDDPQLAMWEPRVRQCGATAVAAAINQPCDAAVLSGSAASVLQAARNVGEVTPVYVVPAAHDAPAIAYGLLPHVEDGRRATPGWAHRAAAAVREYIDRFTRGDLGDLRLVRLDRTQASGPSSVMLTRAEIDEQFFQDIDLLRLVGGDYNRVTAIEIGSDAAGARQSTVTLAAEGAPEAVWSLTPGAAGGWKLLIEGTRTSAELSGDARREIRLAIGGSPIDVPYDDAQQASLQRFVLEAADPISSPAIDPLRP
jgi:hypothetical protein